MNQPTHPPTAAQQPDDYWHHSRQPLASLVFVAPLLVIYEAGVLLLGPQAVRSGADVWLRGLLDLLDLGQYFLLPALTAGILLAWHHTTRRPWRVSRDVLSGLLVESVVLAFCLRAILQVEIVGWHVLVAKSAPAVGPQANVLPEAPGTWAGMIGFLGAGVYEELLFRLILLSAVVWAAKRWGMAAGTAAVVSVLATSLVFAAAHYVGPYGEPVQWAARAFWFGFVFRCLAGIFFSILFVCRGFGVTAGAHAGYDILVKLL
jgi:hypothetical protein